ncbi:hypothetical protein [Salinibacter phage M31CR41-2]|uniref:Uncharacterized protein n=2 Tax=Kairosalinivirus TaxID=2560158 RepID=A0A2I6UH43_9CAUD|nr:hypothetical protein FGG68_gp18 [Salinibacter phage M31CR41-2]AUO79281.1 hypothetical protein [Salinibacter phage M31CR41-2]AUO79351.1 hypothetical protein [Salinibacter virus M31CR41-3]
MTNAKERRRTMRAFNRYRSILANANAKDWEEGRRWYKRANERITEAAEKASEHTWTRPDVLANVFADVVAVLSPMTSWDRNLSVVDGLVTAFRQDYPDRWMFEVLSRHTVYNTNAEKALKVLKAETEPSGPKVEPFAKNLKGNTDAVTIDRHMLSAVNYFELSSITDNGVRSCKRAVRMLGKLHEETPRTVQAAVWTRVRGS